MGVGKSLNIMCPGCRVSFLVLGKSPVLGGRSLVKGWVSKLKRKGGSIFGVMIGSGWVL